MIVVYIVLIILGGVWQIASGMYITLLISGTIVGIFTGIYAIVKSLGVIAARNLWIIRNMEERLRSPYWMASVKRES